MNIITISLSAVSRSISSTGKSGHTDYVFLAMPRDGGGFGSWQRPDNIDGAIITSKVSYGHYSADRRSSTDLEIALPIGTLRKTVRKDVRRGSTTTVERLGADGQFSEVRFVGNKKTASGGWLTLIEIDGQRLEV